MHIILIWTYNDKLIFTKSAVPDRSHDVMSIKYNITPQTYCGNCESLIFREVQFLPTGHIELPVSEIEELKSQKGL